MRRVVDLVLSVLGHRCSKETVLKITELETNLFALFSDIAEKSSTRCDEQFELD